MKRCIKLGSFFVLISFLACVPASGPAHALSFASIGDQDLSFGAPMHLGLDGTHGLGQNLTYTVTSDNPLVEASILSGNRSWRINTQDFGSMTFELFEQRVSRATNQFIQLAEDDFFDGKEFTRIVDGFISQGTGAASPLPAFKDHYHPDIMYSTASMLGVATAHDDGGEAEFFITEDAWRHLDFNYSIFGVLTEGLTTRESINDVAVNASDQPIDPLIITSTEIITDNENGTLFLKALADPTTITDPVEITVTATDEDNNTFEETFLVNVGEDTANSMPFLDDLPDQIGMKVGETIELDVTAFDIEGDEVTFFAAPENLVPNGLTFVQELIDVTPVGMTATMTLSITVDETFVSGNGFHIYSWDPTNPPPAPTSYSQFDRHFVQVTIVPEPGTITLAAIGLVALVALGRRRR